MRRILAVMRQNIENMKKSPKVADENMFGEGNGTEFPIIAHHTRQGRSGLSLIHSIVRAPLSLVSCLSSHPHINGATDGVWVSGELTRISEVNHLMVSDSMRYAILM
ncbi:uncharacterized protein LOC112517019 [Cynara cardunculus var. scolymus]|uniref:Uncharacterized protein n=1 Tax=Cynara cardunculus var. scolymus TaxID=59895 RepID=A0A103XLU6_CYNCS|nr:uncharacterized protein LOC112517019 [Cynara cardunculus var. scolymus]KVH93152.1 hypothetical protein Ccrd_004795 [Cynara cardunculus var. scolymus]